MILDQFELLSKYDEGLYQIEKAGCSEVVNFARAKESSSNFGGNLLKMGRNSNLRLFLLICERVIVGVGLMCDWYCWVRLGTMDLVNFVRTLWM